MNRERALDASWKAWLETNLRRGCSPPELLEILRRNGFSLASIQQSMGDAFPLDTPPQSPLPLPPLVRIPRAKLRKLETDQLDIYTLDDFLSAKHCDRLVALINHHLRPSTVTIEG